MIACGTKGKGRIKENGFTLAGGSISWNTSQYTKGYRFNPCQGTGMGKKQISLFPPSPFLCLKSIPKKLKREWFSSRLL